MAQRGLDRRGFMKSAFGLAAGTATASALGAANMLSLALAIIALMLGAVVLSVLYESVAGNEGFSLPFFNILLVVVVGGTLHHFFGFKSTIAVLAVYGAWCVVGGLLDRRR